MVNEALNENGTFRNSVFFRVLGTDFLPLSFAAAAAADPSAKLYYNDFNLETSPRKADGAARIVSIIRNGSLAFPGARIDGVGFQAHLRVGQTPTQANLTGILKRFVDLGVEVALTELDVAHTSLPAGEEAVKQQGADYVAAVGACLAVERCVGVTVWQFTDRYSWIPGTFPGLGEACLFGEGMERKEAYFRVEGLLLAVVGSVRAVVGSGGGRGGGVGGVGGNVSFVAPEGGGVAGGVGTLGSGRGSGSDDAATAALTSGGLSVVLGVAGARGVYWVLGVVGVMVAL